MSPPPPPPRLSPRRLSASLGLSLITLLFIYINLCFVPAEQSSPSILHLTFPFPFIPHLHGTHQETKPAGDDPDLLPTTTTTSPNITISSNKNKSTITTATGQMGVDDLYQYALASPTFRNAKDAGKLRHFLSCRIVAEQQRGSWLRSWDWL